MGAHAILSPSGAHRWMHCPPSAQLEKRFPDERSDYAAEGTFAHKLADLRLSRAIANTLKPSIYKKQLAELKKDSWYSTALEEYVEAYVAQVTEIFLTTKKNCKDTLVLLEQKLDFSEWVPGGFGTGDVVVISDDTLEVIDLKYGKGVPVSAEDNPQTRLYGLGAIRTYQMLYDFSKVRLTIIQPRLDSISTEELTGDELIAWADEQVKPKAAQANAGKGEFCAGDHCRFCRARATCRARAEHNMELVKYDFQDAFLLTPSEIAEILGKAEELVRWSSDVKEHALDQAINHGEKFPGWKLVEGKSNRKYSDEEAVAQTLIKADYKEDAIYKPKELLGITALEKEVGKKKFSQLLGELIIKPSGKPTLVPESDKRPEINSTDAAKADFSE